MNEVVKFPGQSSIKCPKCGRWMRIRGSSITETYYHAEICCGYCGVYEKLKVPIEEYNSRSDREIVLGEVVEQKSPESIGRRIYGKSGRAPIARRVKKDRG